jgi:hypothetical protein
MAALKAYLSRGEYSGAFGALVDKLYTSDPPNDSSENTIEGRKLLNPWDN